MKSLFLGMLLSIVVSISEAQDYLSTQGAALPGTITLNDGKTVSGKVSYNPSYVFVQPEGSPVVSYPAANVKGFELQNGGGEFVSVSSGKKMRYGFYEITTHKNLKLILVVNATSVENRGKEKDEFGMKITPRYYFYAKGEGMLINTDLKEIAAFMKTRCEGIATAISEYKDKAYCYGPLADKDEMKRKWLRILDDYVNDRCKYIPADY